jgi:pyruvate dehydrogenase E2 component (dihydrolipoamide acetyltransferase)
MDARSRFNTESGTKLSLNAFFIKLAAEAIKRHPRINTTWKGSTIQFHGSVDVGLAVALPDGLITPVVRNCEQKGIMEIDKELSVLIEKSRKGGLKPEEYDGTTFTISNLGNFGIEEFTAIINPPGFCYPCPGRGTERAGGHRGGRNSDTENHANDSFL